MGGWVGDSAPQIQDDPCLLWALMLLFTFIGKTSNEWNCSLFLFIQSKLIFPQGSPFLMEQQWQIVYIFLDARHVENEGGKWILKRGFAN